MQHRLAFHFADEVSGDRAIWQTWIQTLAPSLAAAIELGERRPLLAISAPFANARLPITTPRADEATCLSLVRELVDELVGLARARSRSIVVLLSGHPFGTITERGEDAALAARFDDWRRMLEARPPDAPAWQRDGWVSLWSGTLSREHLDRLLAESHGRADRPGSQFARELGVPHIDHDWLEAIHVESPEPVAKLLARVSASASFADRVPLAARQREVTTLVAWFDCDFSQRARDVAGGRLAFVGAFPFAWDRP